jgi:putative tricarboxylic transport membrane protein
MTVLDGHPMHLKGQGGKALGYAASGSVLGGLFSCVLMVFLCVPLSQVALQFGPAEYAAMAILGIAAISGLGSGNQLKTLIAGCLGLVLATFGTDSITGVFRYTFGTQLFANGVDFIPVMIGAFALSEVFVQAMEKVDKSKPDLKSQTGIKVQFMKLSEIIKYKWTLLRSAIIGMIVGILPGTGATISSVLAYTTETQVSRHPELFGTGVPEGVLAPETANNASTGGAMVPTLCLGIPGSGTTAVILGAFIMHGMQPGPLLFRMQPKLLYAVFISMIIANLLLIIGGIYGVKTMAQVSRLPYYIQGSVIISLCFIGSYALSNDIGTVWIMLMAGVVGFFMKKYHFSVAGLVLGLVLGDLIEKNLRKALIIAHQDWSGVIFKPIAFPFFILAIILFFMPQIRAFLAKRKAKKEI